MTEKLYDKDSHIKEFSAKVLSCEKSGENYAVTLNKTAFFPEGGGQESDRGNIGGAAGLDVQIILCVLLMRSKQISTKYNKQVNTLSRRTRRNEISQGIFYRGMTERSKVIVSKTICGKPNTWVRILLPLQKKLKKVKKILDK